MAWGGFPSTRRRLRCFWSFQTKAHVTEGGREFEPEYPTAPATCGARASRLPCSAAIGNPGPAYRASHRYGAWKKCSSVRESRLTLPSADFSRPRPKESS